MTTDPATALLFEMHQLIQAIKIPFLQSRETTIQTYFKNNHTPRMIQLGCIYQHLQRIIQAILEHSLVISSLSLLEIMR